MLSSHSRPHLSPKETKRWGALVPHPPCPPPPPPPRHAHLLCPVNAIDPPHDPGLADEEQRRDVGHLQAVAQGLALGGVGGGQRQDRDARAPLRRGREGAPQGHARGHDLLRQPLPVHFGLFSAAHVTPIAALHLRTRGGGASGGWRPRPPQTSGGLGGGGGGETKAQGGGGLPSRLGTCASGGTRWSWGMKRGPFEPLSSPLPRPLPSGPEHQAARKQMRRGSGWGSGGQPHIHHPTTR